MLRHRLFFGTLMTICFTGLVVFDGWLDGSLTKSLSDDRPLQGTLLAALVAILVVPAQFEFSKLAAAKGLSIFAPVSIPASILLATTWYWCQFVTVSQGLYVLFVLAFASVGVLLCQYIRHGTDGVMANCGANCFSIVYLGLFSGFVLGIRIEFGLWPVLMSVFVVKSADIGAYAIGSLFGKRKFSPRISPAKTWEGMLAAIGVAILVAIAFAAIFDIMVWWLGLIFGFCFAVIGQAGDLVESMMKRDARQKDSASNVPGFGGVLDVIDSPLLALPFAYLFFRVFT